MLKISFHPIQRKDVNEELVFRMRPPTASIRSTYP